MERYTQLPRLLPDIEVFIDGTCLQLVGYLSFSSPLIKFLSFDKKKE